MIGIRFRKALQHAGLQIPAMNILDDVPFKSCNVFHNVQTQKEKTRAMSSPALLTVYSLKLSSSSQFNHTMLIICGL